MTRQLLLTREDALSAIGKLIKGEECRFNLVTFDKYNAHAKLRSIHYKGYTVLCHANTMRSAGWLLCRYAHNGSCPLEKGLFSFNTEQGGTTRLERPTKSHENGPNIVQFQRQLPAASRSKVARAAALAVALDTRPLSFCDGHAGMREFARAIFEMGQTVPSHEKIDPKSYLPGRTAVTCAVKELSESLRAKFVLEMKNGPLRFGEQLQSMESI